MAPRDLLELQGIEENLVKMESPENLVNQESKDKGVFLEDVSTELCLVNQE